MNANVIRAVFKRNLMGYFSSPIGYVFICVFVLLSGFAAFWPNEFFNNNLATLDELNERLPWIMLVFIPAITMSLWADERRQGTDELVLTLPCSDLDVVVGKYLAALAIYTVALIFSLSNIVVLGGLAIGTFRIIPGLGDPDIGLLLGNYVGYWLVGASMLSIGMVASFLTNSLTVGFILGLIFNAPLVFAQWISTTWGGTVEARRPWMNDVVLFIREASIGEQFRDFGRGLITLSGVAFFASIVVVSLYLSMVLIGRRHWGGGPREGHATAMGAHFAARAFALIGIMIGANAIIHRFDWRIDVSQERINSLSAQTKAILRSLDTAGGRPVYVEAFISPQVPEEYVQTRMNLISMLREADAIAGNKVVVRFHDAQRFSQEEALAEQQFGIRPRPVQSSAGGKMAVDQIMLGAAFSCGLDKVVVPFFDRGTPVEYEVIRSIATVSQQQRKRIGVINTDARLFGGFDIDTFSQRPTQQIIEELQKQYDVVQVNPEQPITERFDALLAVQPSTLPPAGMDNFVAAVQSGQPTAIFEDPFPFLDMTIPATSQPRQNPRRNPFMQQQQQPQPKGDINKLWSALGMQINAQQIVWQDYNPYPKISEFSKIKEFVFIGRGSGASEPFNQGNPITSGLQQVITLFAGAVEPAVGAATKHLPLVQTSSSSGYVMFDDVLTRNFFGQGNINVNRRMVLTRKPYTVAAHIVGDAPAPAEGEQGSSSQGGINVVLVSDIDLLSSEFFAIRARGSDRDDPVRFDFDNVTFVLNTLDFLAGDDRFVELRKRRPTYRTLTKIEQQTEIAKQSANDERDRFVQQFETKRAEEQKKLDDKLADLKKRQESGGVDPMQALNEVSMAQQAGQNRLNTAIEQFEKERDRELEKIERRLALEVRQVQNKYKLAAVIFPAIPPLLVGAFVFQRRRRMEKIGVPKARMR